MPTLGTKNNEWGDPYPILEEGQEPSPKERLTAELEQELVSEFQQTHTTTPLDSRNAFYIQQLDEQADDTCYFRAKRFVGRSPAGTYTGIAVETDTGWLITFEDSPHFIHRIVRWFKSVPDMLGCLQQLGVV